MAMVHLSAAMAVLAFPVDGEEFLHPEKASSREAQRAEGDTPG